MNDAHRPPVSSPGAGMRVLAVVVSYFAGPKVAATVQALAGQVERILVVDNGSDAPTLEALRELEARGLIELRALGANKGLGVALNIGAVRAHELAFDWLLTMDQDSLAGPGMVAAMLELARRDPRVRSVSPNIALHGHAPTHRRSGPVSYAITSGNLVHMDVWRAAGPYNEGFFIDCIDFDFCLRARREGYTVHKAPDALLHHELGQKVERRRRFERFYTQHSAMRRYYMFRNFFFLARSHALREPRFIAKLAVSQLLLFVLIVAYEPRLRENLVFIGRGILDFLRNRQGAYGKALP